MPDVSLLLSFLAMIGLFFVIDQTLWLYVSIIYFVSAFLSKYYTAAPFKFGYRGIGEILIWFSFGPMAIMLAGFSQNMMMQETFYAVMPATGFSTLTILWIGQLIDLPDDKAAGKYWVGSPDGYETSSLRVFGASIIAHAEYSDVGFFYLPSRLASASRTDSICRSPSKDLDSNKKTSCRSHAACTRSKTQHRAVRPFFIIFYSRIMAHPSLKIFRRVDEIVYHDQCNRLIPIFSTRNFSVAGMKPGMTKGG